MPATHSEQVLSSFARQTIARIPLLESMQVSFTRFTGCTLRVDMPLAPNINDKNTGFGGSIAALATTCGWAMVSLLLEDVGRQCQVVIVESRICYLAPVTGNCYAETSVCEEDKYSFMERIARRGKSRIELSVAVMQDGVPAAEFTGSYFVKEAAP
ncbi:MAG: YiiD C-terminal domain-containing protein [Porticoccaceae bacterium]